MDFQSELFERACLVCNKTSFFPIQVSSLIPDLKLSEFLKSLKATFGLAFDINSSEKTVTVKKIASVLASSEAIDFTPFLEPIPEIASIPTEESKAFKFGFSIEDNAEGERFADMPATHTVEDAGQLYLHKETNSYFKLEYFNKQVGNDNGLELLNIFRQGFLVNQSQFVDGLQEEASSAFVPIPNQTTFIEQWNDAEINIPNLTSRRTGNLKNSGIEFKVRILDSEAYNDAFYDTTTNVNPFSNEITVVGLNPNGSERKDVEFLFSVQSPFMTGSVLNLPNIKDGLDGKPLITMFHGIQKGYSYASSSNYSPDGTTVFLDTSLRWEEPAGIIQNLFSEFEKASQNRKQYTFRGYLPLSKALNSKPLTKIMIEHVAYLVTSLELKFRNDRRNERVMVEVECRRV